ncbi:MAG: sugar transferase [Candidatus Dormibacteraeota bacterium]|nr:sugar transferase [Candidatus Dormibacteraeota bacterium]
MALEISRDEVLGSAVPSQTKLPSRNVVARRALVIVALTVLLDLLMVTFSYTAARAERRNLLPDPAFLGKIDPVILATIPCWLIVFFAFGMYSRDQVLEPTLRLPRLLGAITVSIFVMILVAFGVSHDLHRSFLAILLLVSTVLIVWERFMMLRLSQILNEVHWIGLRTMVVGVGNEARTLARVLAKKRHLGYEVLGFVGPTEGKVDTLPVVGTMDSLRQTVIDRDIAAIFVAGSGTGAESLIHADAALTGLAVRIRTSLGLPHLGASRVVVRSVDGMAMLAVERVRRSQFELVMKRTLDLTLSIVGLIIGLPAMIVIAIAIRMSGEGPIIFSQTRVGEGGVPFTMYKFRTMVKDAEQLRQALIRANEADGSLFKMRRDPRITPIGRHLRRLGLDEIPQLVNVLLGEMSLVGPRPALPSERESWSPEVALRLNAKPGLTGLWQVSGRHELAFEDYIRYDLFYVQNWSFVLDLQIIARTVPALLSRNGAY